MRQEVDDIAREIHEINDSIARLKTIRRGLESTHEMAGIDQTIDRLTAKRAGLVQKQKAGQLKLQQTRDTGQKRLGRRVGKRLEQEFVIYVNRVANIVEMHLLRLLQPVSQSMFMA